MPTRDAQSVAAIVLAAGQSRRMGGANKLRLSFGEGTVLAAVIDTLATAGLEGILVVTGHAAAAVRSDLTDRPVRFVHNQDYATGMASSIRAGVEAAPPEAGGFMLFLGDLPALRASTVRRLLDAFEQQPAPGAPILIPTVAGERGHPVLFDGAYREALLNLEGDAGARPVLRRHSDAIIEVAVPDEGILDDIDTPERYRHVLHKHRRRAATGEDLGTGPTPRMGPLRTGRRSRARAIDTEDRMSSALGYALQGDESKPCIMFLHGFMGSRADWEPVCAGLWREYRCLTVDLPGHGQSRYLADGNSYTMAGAVQAIEALLDQLSIDRCTVVGYSMGGRLALLFALEAPERCRRLVVESATPGLRRETGRVARRAVDEERAAQLESGDFTTFLARWYEQPLFETLARHEGLVARMIQSRRDNDPKELARALRGLSVGRQPSLWERLEQLQVSTMVVAGALDGKYAEIAENMAVRTDRVRTAILPNVGHNVHVENPTAYINLLKDFLNHP